MRNIHERMLRECIRRSLKEYYYDYGGVTPWTAGYGGSTKSSRASTGSYGTSLYDIFVAPFVDAAKVIFAELSKTGVRVLGLLATTVEAALSTLVPGFEADYDKIQKLQAARLGKIREKYKAAYEAIDDYWDNPDVQLFAFMHDPSAWLAYKAITAKPEAALNLYEQIADGNKDLLLYLRDIRNRMYGAQAPGANIHPGGFGNMPVRGEGKVNEAPQKKKKKTPGEIAADMLTSPEFKAALNQLPIVKQMKTDAKALETQSTAQLKAAMRPVLDASTVPDLVRASDGKWKPSKGYSTLSSDDQDAFDDTITSQVKASMASYYMSRTQELIKQALQTGISENSPYVTSLRSMITSLEPITKAVPSRKIKDDGIPGSNDGGRATGRDQGTEQAGRGVRDQDADGGSGDRPTQGRPQGTSGRVQGKA